jgi:4-alpha-glucanotransferase
MSSTRQRRGSGILLHITSLPSPSGIGDLGLWAYRFADFLAETKQSFWQILPLNPTDPVYGNSPYHSISAFASNPLLISPELMVRDGLLDRAELETLPNRGKVDYEAVIAHKRGFFRQAYERFKERGRNHEYERFCSENSYWLEDFALFIALKSHFDGKAWNEWPGEIRDREPEVLESLKEELCDRIGMEKFLQYIFIQQWNSLKGYCNQRCIQIIGDIPIYVDYDSADLWTNPEIFKLDDEKKPYVVSGVPPDYFSETGQLWGNPVYRWDVLRERGYDWWVQRLEHNLKLFDYVRIDHFRGLVAYWEVPAGEETAIDGEWVEVPVVDFLSKLTRRFSCLPIIAEDLGLITPDVREIMQLFDFPGMKVLLFAFGEGLPTNPYIPHNVVRNCVLYTGTHDINTVRGWFEGEATPADKERLFQYLGREVPVEDLHWELVRLAMMSVANSVITPMQDLLGLGEDARMNLPATSEGNWGWRLSSEQLTSSLARKLLEMTEICGRA